MSTWKPVTMGSYGGFVSAVQANLWASGWKSVTGEVDGAFGPNTDQGVRYFQSEEGLDVDGDVGPHTWGAFDSYVIDGYSSRTYDNPGTSVYTVYYTTYYHSNFSYTEGSLDRYDYPYLKTFTVWTEGSPSYSANNQLKSDFSTFSTEEQTVAKQGFNFEQHQNRVNHKMNKIKDSGFQLRLPEQAPNHARQVVKIVKKKFKNGSELVMTQYGDKGDRKKGKWDVTVQQERLNDRMNYTKAIQHVENTIGAKKQLKKLSIKGHPAYIYIHPSNQKGLNSIWVITKNYGYTIASPTATKQELIKTARSINY